MAQKFEVSRSPVREALLALEKEGTTITSPHKGSIVKPLAAAVVRDTAELRLALMMLAAKRPTVIFHQPTLTSPTGSQRKRPAATAPKNTSNTIAAFGTLYSRTPNGLFFGRCFGNWTIESLVITPCF